MRCLLGDTPLLLRVACGLVRVRAQVFAKGVMAVPVLASPLDHVDVMSPAAVFFASEKEPAGKAVLAEILVPKALHCHYLRPL